MQNEFSRIIALDDVRDKEFEFEHKAKPQELEALAKRLNLVSIDSFEVDGMVSFGKRDRIYKVSGTLSAEIVQNCSVTLEDFSDTIHLDFEEKLILEKDFDKEQYQDMESWEIPEIIESDELDYGEVITQILSLTLDPYPRKAGAEIDPRYTVSGTEEPMEKTCKPFVVLEKLKKKSNDE